METRRADEIEVAPGRFRDVIDKDTAGWRIFVESVKVLGILQPITVNTRNQLKLGWRRLEAAREAGLEFVPVDVRDDLEDERAARVAEATENAQRESLSPKQLYRAIRYLWPIEEARSRESQAAGLRQGDRPPVRESCAHGRTADRVG